MQNRRTTALALIALFAAAGLHNVPARAHDDANGPNGGQVVEAKGHHLELTATAGDIVVYVYDAAHAPRESQGATGRAVILDGAKQSTVQLSPAEPNRLTAKLDAPLAPGARVVVSTKLGDGQDLLARFVVK